MTLWENTRASLSALPLLDAAYRLWMERRKLDLEEVPTKSAPTVSSASPPDDGAIREAIENVTREQITAPEGKTFARLKASHPEANDDDLKSAIEFAVKLDSDCTRNFTYRSPHYFDDCKRAVELSQVQNPGFSEETYKHAEQHLMFVMR